MNRSRRPGSYGAFLLAVHNVANEESIRTEFKRAQDAGTAINAIDSVLKKLSNGGFWIRNPDGVKLTEKGLRFLREHDLIGG